MNAIQTLLTEHIDIWTAADTEKKSGRGRSSANATSVYGIRKLRELILELAVHGKLVPQDANDEPASELLKRIQAEKAKLFADGEIKKDKPLAPIGDEEKLFEIPREWELVRLGSILNRISNGYSGGQSKTPSDFPLTRIETISKAVIDFDKVGYCSDISEIDVEKFALTKGDILISHINSDFHLGKTAVYEGSATLIHGINLLLLRPSSLISYQYLHNVLTCMRFAGYFFTIAQHAIGQSSINQTKICEILLALPPLAEQHRIVTKVEELMALCDQLETQHNNATEAHEKLVSHLLGTLTQSQSAEDFSANWQRIAAHFDTLFTTEASIDVLKRTLLQLAVMGKLVPQDPKDEPASELIKRIQAEKAKLIAEGKIKKENPLILIADDEKPFDLPLSWAWERMGNICRPVSSGSTPPAEHFQYEEGVPFLKVYNIRNQKVDFDYKKQFVDEKYHASKLKRSIIYPGDVIMNIVGPPLGKVAIIENSYPEWNCNQAIVFFGLIEPMSSKYILNFLKEGSFLNGIELIGTAGQDNISVTKSKNIPVPIPPLAEQRRIVAKVDELMSLCEQLKTRITEASQLQQKLAAVMVEQAVA